jgi:hypothetical protein
MLDLKQSKSILARLLSQENLSVIHSAEAKTASFDLQQRTLICPMWQDMDGSLYDLMMGHETGHALYTPAEGWHDAVTETNINKFKPILNIVEDARIEKKQKQKYPGLRRSFYQAYSELMRRDFFGINKIPGVMDHLNVLDRINLHFKVGSMLNVPFSEKEREFVARIENVEEWDDVVAISKELYAYSKENEGDKINNLQELQDVMDQMQDFLDEDKDEDLIPDVDSLNDSSEENEEQEGDDGQDGEETDEFDDVDSPSDDDGEGEEEESDGPSDEEIQQKLKEIIQKIKEEPKEEEEEPRSVTDQVFREKEKELIEDEKNPTLYLDLPEADLSKIILPFRETYDDFDQTMRQCVQDHNRSMQNWYKSDGREYAPISLESVGADLLSSFNQKNKKYISLMIKNFEMHKNANQYARERVSKTGDLDTRKLHKYKMTNDIFRKVTTVDKGKSHGMVLFLDLSGSMRRQFAESMEQILVLVAFCKMINLPFEVYGFCNMQSRALQRYFNRADRGYQFITTPNSFHFEDIQAFHLKEMINSNMSVSEYKKAFNMLLIVGNLTNEYNRDSLTAEQKVKYCNLNLNLDAVGFGMHSTPFEQTSVASIKIIENFRKKYKNDIVNVVYVSDGEGNGDVHHRAGSGSYTVSKRISAYSKNKIVFRDKNSNEKVVCSKNGSGGTDVQASITALVKKVTGVQHIGFYLVDGNFRHCKYVIGEDKYSSASKLYRENGFVELPSMGYDSYYFINPAGKETNLRLDETDKKDNRKIAKKFMKSQGDKHASRAVLSNFAKQVAT